MELYKKYRPDSFSKIVGNEQVIASLENLIKKNKIPHAILFTGPSGTGKTTIARILKKELDCADYDFVEINAASARGIDDVREMNKNIYACPMGGKSKLFLIDEAHQLTSEAQTALLKMLEDPPSHAYFILCTTEERKLKNTIHTRCTTYKMSALDKEQLKKLITMVCVVEKVKLTEEVLDLVIDVSEGSARKCLVVLEQIIAIPDVRGQLESINKIDQKKASIDLCRALLNQKSTWKDISAILKTIDEEPETVRRIVLGYMNSVALNSGMPRAINVITEFQFNYYDSGKAGLTLSCFNVVKK